jgi:hypothetical protein
MIEDFLIMVATIVTVIFIHLSWTNYGKSGYRELEKWAMSEGYTILESELRLFKTGPFFFSGRTRIQRVFYVTLEDKDGKCSKAWIKLGGIIFGLLSGKVEVKWEDEELHN